jgi:hypothetical protein
MLKLETVEDTTFEVDKRMRHFTCRFSEKINSFT